MTLRTSDNYHSFAGAEGSPAIDTLNIWDYEPSTSMPSRPHSEYIFPVSGQDFSPNAGNGAAFLSVDVSVGAPSKPASIYPTRSRLQSVSSSRPRAGGRSYSRGRRPSDNRRRRPVKEEPSTPHIPSESLNDDHAKSAHGSKPMGDVWPLYLEHALAEDKEMVQAWNTDLDSILIFAALFSAVLTTFIIESYQDLQPDPTTMLLQSILDELQVTPSAVRVNVYWFSSLILSLATALIAILAKQWVNYLLAGLSPVPSARARHRQYRIDGMHKWRLPTLLSFLPILLHIALLLFFASLVDFVWDLNTTLATFCAFLVCTACLAYVTANILAYVYPDCPFKTSVTVFVAATIDFLVISYRNTCLAVVKASVSLQRACVDAIAVGRSWYRGIGSTQGEIGPRQLSRAATIGALKVQRKYEPLRISSLRSQDEKFIAKNKSLMDARILLSLMQNADRLHKAEQLTDAIVRFPHLTLHRRLFIQEGAMAFLERLLKSWKSTDSSRLPEDRRGAVQSILHALAALESETGVNDSSAGSFKTALDPEDTLASSLRPSPFLMIQATVNPSKTPLSPRLFPVILSLLGEASVLPLSMLSFVLRLCVRMPREDSTPSQPTVEGIVLRFLERVMIDRPPVEERYDVTDAVNTVIYLALHDVSYPQRFGFVTPVIWETHDWLEYLSKLMHRSSITASARRQLCWVICAIAASIQSQSNSGITAVIKPRIPRLERIEPIADRLTWLVSCTTEPNVLSASLAALEATLWHAEASAHPDVEYTMRLLCPIHTGFTAEFARRLDADQIPVTDAARIVVPITRIAVYLSTFGRGPIVDTTKLSLLHNTMAILVAVIKKSRSDLPSLSMDVFAIRQYRSQADTATFHGAAVRLWIYRATCRIVNLLLGSEPDPMNEDGSAFVPAAPYDLILPIATPKGVGRALASTMQSLANVPKAKLEPLVLQSFITILQDVFGRLRSTVEPSPRTHPGFRINIWDQEVLDIVGQFVAHDGIVPLLTTLSTESAMVQNIGVVSAIRTLLVGLNIETRPHDPQRSWETPYNQGYIYIWNCFWHSLKDFGSQNPRFFQVRADELCSADRTQALGQTAQAHDIVSFIRIFGQLAFPDDEELDAFDEDAIVALVNLVTTALPIIYRSPRTADLAVMTARRHALGVIGSLVTLLAAKQTYRGAREDIKYFFVFDSDDQNTNERIALGLLRALDIATVEPIDRWSLEPPHCDHCKLGDEERLNIMLLHRNAPDGGKIWNEGACGNLLVPLALLAIERTLEHDTNTGTTDSLRGLGPVSELLLTHGLLRRLQVILPWLSKPYSTQARTIHDTITSRASYIPPLHLDGRLLEQLKHPSLPPRPRGPSRYPTHSETL
ncbi:hypothetical protein ONZ51_g11929 [Trametes cubensis]|uniref:DUF6535 domain-containing protein n=1 Tax=Trametes cubensis TaxID=1111947 RepID=A0AAD7TGM5_9APHY|nr:hypothetical protein ONZ51_g11929 [Trametes cubensis]